MGTICARIGCEADCIARTNIRVSRSFRSNRLTSLISPSMIFLKLPGASEDQDGTIPPRCIHITEMRARMESSKGARVLLPFSLLILSISWGCSTEKATKASAASASPKEAAVAVQVFPVESREVRRTVEAVGSLFPFDEVAVSAEVDGRAE